MIDREQVLHVARLARLELTDDEVERMSGELSTILDHVERMNELDLDGVEPTSHVVALRERAARRRAATELAARADPRAGARPGRGGVPRSLSAGVTEATSSS